MNVRISRLSSNPDLPLPSRQSAHAAGYDVASSEQDFVLAVGERRAVATGFVFELPEGFEMQVRPRSGLALKHGITLPNAPGTIDADYRGELGVLLVNLGQETFVIRHGDRVAQLVIAPVVRAEVGEVEPVERAATGSAASAEGRGAGGFGSTGGFGPTQGGMAE